MKKEKKTPKTALGKFWQFVWEDDSIWSWLFNVAIAFILIKFIIYPGLGLILGTNYPVVAVVSGSMEHEGTFDDWWGQQEYIYQSYNISRRLFERFPMSNGFSKGDIIVLQGSKPENIRIGDVIVFRSKRPDPIIHRVIQVHNGTDLYYSTKGDHNYVSISDASLDEKNIPKDALLGKAWIKIPFLGYVKIWFVELLSFVSGGRLGASI